MLGTVVGFKLAIRGTVVEVCRRFSAFSCYFHYVSVIKVMFGVFGLFVVCFCFCISRLIQNIVSGFGCGNIFASAVAKKNGEKYIK